MRLRVTVDGGCTHKRMYAGIVIRDNSSGDVLCVEHRYLGFGTNNQAEYLAIILACKTIEELYKNTAQEVFLFTDSQLAFYQLGGAYQIRNKKLKELHKRAITWMRHRIPVPVHLTWHSREDEDGPLADKLASSKYMEVFDGCDDSVVKRGAGKYDSTKAPGGGIRPGTRKSHCLENKTEVAHRGGGCPCSA